MKRQFKSINSSIFNGLATKKGNTGNVKVSVPQVDKDGQPLSEYVNSQKHLIEVEGRIFKFKGAFLGDYDLCGIVENLPTGETGTQYLPAKTVKITPDLDLETLPQHVKDTASKGRIVDPNYEGEGQYNKYIDGSWKLVKENVEVYLQTINGKGDDLPEDDRKKVFSPYTPFIKCGVGFFNGVPVADGKNVKGKEGTLMVFGDYEDRMFNTPNAASYGAKISAATHMGMLAHSTYGIVKDVDLNANGFPKGSIKVDNTKYEACRIYMADGTLSEIIHLPCYRLGDFIAKGTRKVATDAAAETELKVEEEVSAIKEETTDAYEL